MITILRLILFFPFSIIFAILVEFRRIIYGVVFKPKKLKPIIVSVGNLTSGGTGKTPFVMELIQALSFTGKKIVVVSRSYKSLKNSTSRVELVSNASELYGDEPSLIAQKFPGVPVFVGPNKLETCLEVERILNPDIILVDDGFQHVRLHRDVDIVLIDVTEPRWHYLPLPAGYGRDALWQLDRAAIIVLTKENLAEPQQRDFACSLVSSHTNVIGMDYIFGDLKFVLSEKVIQLSELKRQKVLLVSGIGRPKTFHTLVANYPEIQIVGQIDYKDHHPYTLQDIEKVLDTANELKAKYILVTEKDAIKLKGILKTDNFISVALKTKVRGLDDALKGQGLL